MQTFRKLGPLSFKCSFVFLGRNTLAYLIIYLFLRRPTCLFTEALADVPEFQNKTNSFRLWQSLWLFLFCVFFNQSLSAVWYPMSNGSVPAHDPVVGYRCFRYWLSLIKYAWTFPRYLRSRVRVCTTGHLRCIFFSTNLVQQNVQPQVKKEKRKKKTSDVPLTWSLFCDFGQA